MTCPPCEGPVPNSIRKCLTLNTRTWPQAITLGLTDDLSPMRRTCPRIVGQLLMGVLLGSLPTAPEASDLSAIRVPNGFSVETVADSPFVKYPMLGGFDPDGRLYVCESAGKNLDEAGMLRERPNFISRLEDSDGDGRFDRKTVFADQMTFPAGVLWHQGAVYVTSPPYLWRLEDTNGDGVADRRDPIVGTFRSLGHAGDIHGPFLTPDGRLAFTDAPLGHEIKDRQGQVLHKGTAARVFLCDPDGSQLETFCGGGTYNPIEVAFTPTGEMLGIMTWYNPDEARHDALVHYILNGVYPRRVDAWINEFQQTGPLMPALIRYGLVAPSSIARYRSDAFGSAYRDTYFISFYNTHRIDQIVLERDGATFKARQIPFLESSNPDFRACDVIEDADGSLLVIDTGGWFVNGCPSAQVAKPERLGAIYRIRREGAVVQDPRGRALDWNAAPPTTLAARLADPRPAVQDRAVELLGRPNPESLGTLRAVLTQSTNPEVRIRALWALARHRTPEAHGVIRQGFRDLSLEVRLAVERTVGSDRDAASLPELLHTLRSESPAERRESASALSRLGNVECVPAVLDELDRATDRFLEHALIDALIQSGDEPSLSDGLRRPSPAARRGALIALDQKTGKGLRPDQARLLLADPDTRVRQRAVDAIARRPQWVQEAVGQLQSWLTTSNLDPEGQASLRHLLSGLWNQEPVRTVAAAALASPSTTPDRRRLVLQVWAQDGQPKALKDWQGLIRTTLDSFDDTLLMEGLSLARAARTHLWNESITRVALNPDRAPAVRLRAADTLSTGAPLPDPIHSMVVEVARQPATTHAMLRLQAARLLGQVPGTSDQLWLRTEVVAQANGVELTQLLPAFERPLGDATALDLAAALDRSPGRDALSVGVLERIAIAAGPSTWKALTPMLTRLHSRQSGTEERYKARTPSLTGGDPEAGRRVFHDTRSGCALCHRIAGEGGTLGPDLSTIGEVRTRRDLLESILFPSASYARGYEPIEVVHRDGERDTGVLHQETELAVELRLADHSLRRIPRNEVQSLGIGSQSLMPEGLEGSLSVDTMRDLLAFLESLEGSTP